MLTVRFAKEAFQALPPKDQKLFTKWLENLKAADLPKKKRKQKSNNVESLEETRQKVHKRIRFM